jgi:hypothetical protein
VHIQSLAYELPTSERTPHAGKLLKGQEFAMVDETETTLCHCGKVVKVVDMEIRFSGCVHFYDNICKGTSCGKGLEKFVTMVCAKKGCMKVVQRFSPAKAPDGFEYKAGKIYHVIGCPACTPGIESAKCVEHLLWTKTVSGSK